MVVRRFKVREQERGLLFRDKQFEDVLGPGVHWRLDPLRKLRVDVVPVRLPWLERTDWRLLILDEAQAIKNPGAKQTRVAKKLRARSRIALTGTPIENRLGDLWSIFDFINPGLLGSAKEFTSYTKRLASGSSYGPLRDLVRPYILRRLKTDRAVISDLPDKTEVKANPGPMVQGSAYDIWLRAPEAVEDVLAEIPKKGLIYDDHLDGFYIFREAGELGDAGVGDGRTWRINKSWIIAIADAA